MVGQKEKKKRRLGGETERERGGEEKRGERHLQIHTGGEVWKLECHIYLVTALKQVSNIADLTSSVQRSSLLLRFVGYTTGLNPETKISHFKKQKNKSPSWQIGSRTVTDLITL